MKQIEFEAKLREMRAQRDAEQAPIKKMQAEVVEEMAAISRQITELSAKRQKLKHLKTVYGNQMLAISQTWGGKIEKFMQENMTTERTLSEVSEYSLAAELHARGYTGELINPDKPEDFMASVNYNLNN